MSASAQCERGHVGVLDVRGFKDKRRDLGVPADGIITLRQLGPRVDIQPRNIEICRRQEGLETLVGASAIRSKVSVPNTGAAEPRLKQCLLVLSLPFHVPHPPGSNGVQAAPASPDARNRPVPASVADRLRNDLGFSRGPTSVVSTRRPFSAHRELSSGFVGRSTVCFSHTLHSKTC